MRHHPDTLEAAFRVALRLDYEAKDGGPGVVSCPACDARVFVVERYGPDDVSAHGYCLNPACNYERVTDDVFGT